MESREKEAFEKAKIGTVQRLHEMRISLQNIAKASQVSVETAEQWLGLVRGWQHGSHPTKTGIRLNGS